MKRLQSADLEFVNKMTEIVISNITSETFGVKELARISGMSRSSLNNRFRATLNTSINQFIKEIRLRKAFELLHDDNLTASEVAFRVGFKSHAYFTACFHEFYGYPPGKVDRNEISSQETALRNPASHFRTKTFSVRFLMKAHLIPLVLAVVFTGVVMVLKTVRQNETDAFSYPDGKISIAVMPFLNYTNDTIWNIWQYGIQTNLYTSLANVSKFKVSHNQTVNNLLKVKGFNSYATYSPSAATDISKILNANVAVMGNITQSGALIRINVQLVDTRTETALNSFHADGPPSRILNITDSVSGVIKNFLLIKDFGARVRSIHADQFITSSISAEAYSYFMQGLNAFYRNDFTNAIDWYLQSLKIDTGFIGAMANISSAYYQLGDYENGKLWCTRYNSHYDRMTIQQKIWARLLYATYFGNPTEKIKYLRQLIEFDHEQPLAHFQLGEVFLETRQYIEAVAEFENALSILSNLGIQPYWGAFYTELGKAYHMAGLSGKEGKLYKKAEKIFPDDPDLMLRKAFLLLSVGDTTSAGRNIDLWIDLRMKQLWPESVISDRIGTVYSDAGYIHKAEEYKRNAVLLEPDNPVIANNLAYFLIDKDVNITEGIKISEILLEKDPDNFRYLMTLGWGYFKQHRYNDALVNLSRSWDLRQTYSVFDYDAYVQLEKVRKTAGVKK